MAREPSYPGDAKVGANENELKAANDQSSGSKRTRHLVTGAAIGIGSAALVAALLYAGRWRKDDDEEKSKKPPVDRFTD